MSDQNNGTGTPNPAANQTNQTIEQLKQANDALMGQLNNMKAEFNRKIANVEQKVTPRQQEPQEEPLEDLIYTNPKKVVDTITQQVTQTVNQSLDARQQQASVIGDLMFDYPELQDKNSDFFKATVKAYEGLSPEEQRNASIAYKLAVKTAALDMGLAPRAKRQMNDDFAMTGSGSGNSSRRQREPEVDDATLAFAAAVGLNTQDPKVVERIKMRAQRKNWNRYE